MLDRLKKILYEFTRCCNCPFEKGKLAYYATPGCETHCRTRDCAPVSNIAALKLLFDNESFNATLFWDHDAKLSFPILDLKNEL
jgi:hypothetical protein